MAEVFVDSDGVRLWTASHGSGLLPVILCNGGPGCSDYLAPVAQLLEDRVHIIRFEQRGCGRSDCVPPYNIETCLSDLESIRRHYGIDRWIIAGHSWGADLALIYALHYPQNTRGLICIAGGRVHNDREWHQAYRQKRDQGLEPPPPGDYPPNLEVNEQVVRAWKQYIQRPSLLHDLSRLSLPALFIYGDEDIRPSWPVEQVASLLPNARLEMIKGANHYVWLTHAEKMKVLLSDFMARLSDD